MYPDVFLLIIALFVLTVFLFFPIFVLFRLWSLSSDLTALKRQQEDIQAPDIAALHRDMAKIKQELLQFATGNAAHETVGTVERETAVSAVTLRPEHVTASAMPMGYAPAVPLRGQGLHTPQPPPLPPKQENPRVSPVYTTEQSTAPTQAVVKKPVPAAKHKDLESMLGANWLAKLGIAAIAVAVAFFLQYAFRSGLIGPTAQVAIGLCGAAAMLGGGQYLLTKKPYRSYAQVLASGGIVVFFLSIYAAYAFYHPRLLGYSPAFAAFAIGALATSMLALANDTEVVAILCILGAFAAPVLIREGGTSAPHPESLLRLYAYLAVLNVWVVGLLRFRAWHSLAVVAFASTWLLFYNAGSLKNSGWATEGFAALFLLFSCYMGVRGMYAKQTASAEGEQQGLPDTAKAGVGLVVGGCMAFTFASALILNTMGVLGLPDVSLAGILVAL